MACARVDGVPSKDLVNDAYWIVYYFPILIMLFSVLSMSEMQALMKTLSPGQISASTSVPLQHDSSTTDLSSDTNKGTATKSEGPVSSPLHTTEVQHPHQSASTEDASPSTTAMDRKITFASVWHLVQLYLINRMVSLAKRFIQETGGDLREVAMMMLGVCTFFVILSNARLDQAWDAVRRPDTAERGERQAGKRGKERWFKVALSGALFSMLIPWYILIRA